MKEKEAVQTFQIASFPLCKSMNESKVSLENS